MSHRTLLLVAGIAAGLSAPALAQKQAVTVPPPMAAPMPPRAPATGAQGTPAATPITFGQPINDRVNADGRCMPDPRARYYQFSAPANTRIELTMQSSSFDTVVAIGHFNGCAFESIADNDDGTRPGDGTNSRLTGTLINGGSYVVKAAALSDAVMSGGYSIALNRLPARPTDATPAPLPLRIGAPVSGRLGPGDPVIADQGGANEFASDAGRPYRLYSLSGRAGQTVNLALNSDDFDSFLEVGSMSPLGFAAADSNDDGDNTGLNRRLTITFPTTGTMIVRVSPLSPASGRYTLTATYGSAAPQRK